MNQAYTIKNYSAEESIGYLLKRAGGALTQTIDRELAPFDLTHAQLGIFVRLLHSDQGKTASELAREQVCDSGSMTRMLDRLEEKGFIERERSPDDRRVVHVALTKKGEQMADQVVRTTIACLNHHLRGFSPAEIEQFKDFLRRMAAAA